MRTTRKRRTTRRRRTTTVTPAASSASCPNVQNYCHVTCPHGSGSYRAMLYVSSTHTNLGIYFLAERRERKSRFFRPLTCQKATGLFFRSNCLRECKHAHVWVSVSCQEVPLSNANARFTNPVSRTKFLRLSARYACQHITRAFSTICSDVC